MDITYTLEQLCALADLPVRTARYYMQLGLVDRHQGDRRHAHYTQTHLDQLLQVKSLADQGVPLERIRQRMSGVPDDPLPTRIAGDMAVVTKVFVAPGVELHIEPQLAGLSPEKLRQFVGQTLENWSAIHDSQ